MVLMVRDLGIYIDADASMIPRHANQVCLFTSASGHPPLDT